MKEVRSGSILTLRTTAYTDCGASLMGVEQSNNAAAVASCGVRNEFAERMSAIQAAGACSDESVRCAKNVQIAVLASNPEAEFEPLVALLAISGQTWPTPERR